MRHPRPGVLTPCQLVVCGVAASGKSTLAAALAAELGWPFVEGDDLHPPANRAKMAAGIPLDDEDRRPWLDAVAGQLNGWHRSGEAGIVTCSALKRSYRDRLRSGADVRFVFLVADAQLIGDRFTDRRGHFMPASLIASQFAALEPPGDGEPVIAVAAALPVERQVAAVVAELSGR